MLGNSRTALEILRFSAQLKTKENLFKKYHMKLEEFDSWFEFIQRCRTSGMNDKDFCREQGISQTSLYRHIRKLKEKAYELPKNSKHKHEVVPLTVYDEPTFTINDMQAEPKGHGICRDAHHDGSRIHILYGGFRLDIDEGADKSTLRDTLSILQKIC